jgi:hypothetical protein
MIHQSCHPAGQEKMATTNDKITDLLNEIKALKEDKEYVLTFLHSFKSF